MFPPPENWQGGSSADRTWQEGYHRLGWEDQAIINDLANREFGGSQIEAMKARFKGNITMALMGRLPKDWQLYSAAERKALQETSHDVGFRTLFKDLLVGIDTIDDNTPIDPNAVIKNSKPKQ